MTTYEDENWRRWHWQECPEDHCKICNLINENRHMKLASARCVVPWWFNGVSGMALGGGMAAIGYLLAKWLFG
jgi:hypothetical protein